MLRVSNIKYLSVAPLLLSNFTRCDNNNANDFFSSMNKPQLPNITIPTNNTNINTSVSAISNAKSQGIQLTAPTSNNNNNNKPGLFSSLFGSKTSNTNTKSVQVKEDRILVFGETGVGKSTLINTMTNYFNDGDLSNIKVSIPTRYLKQTEGFKNSELDVKNTGSSQTKDTIEYGFNLNNDKFYIIDTPGLCDTRGSEKDDENIEKIINSAIQVNKLSGIVIVMNGSNSRVNNNIKNVLVKFGGIFPDSIMNNIIVVFTCCRKETCNFTSLDELGIKPFKIFYMNNSAFSVDPKSLNMATDPILNLEWKLSMDEINTMINDIRKMSQISTFEFEQMRRIRNNIKSKLHEAKLNIKQIQQLQDEYMQAKNAADLHGATSEQFKNFTVQKKITKQVLTETNYHSTICGNCNKVCHSHCGLDEIHNKEDHLAISNCACFTGGNACSNCGCSPHSHYHDRKDMIEKEVTLDEELADIKQKYLDEMKQVDDATQAMNEHELVIKSIEKKMEDLKQSISLEVIDLKKICKGYNLVGELTSVITQIEQEKVLLKTVESQQSAQQFIDTLKQLINQFSN